jgi:hypothetical protein
MSKYVAAALALFLSACNGGDPAWVVSANGITIKANARFAAAIYSLQWNGREFIDSYDHGRELQSAVSFDGHGECYNPTEAGSRHDHTGPSSTSRVISATTEGNRLDTKSRMAFWVRPGETAPGCGAAVNKTALSDYLLTKRVTIAGNIVTHEITFTVPRAHNSVQFEALTAYLPASFSVFHAYDKATKALIPLSDGPGEQGRPVVIATPDGNYALGVRCDGPAVYGRFRFPVEGVTKWNGVFRPAGPIAAGDYRFVCRSIVGTVQQVTTALSAL